MSFGYTLLDPLIVVLGTAYAALLLVTKPVRVMAFLPAALTLYFFIPTVTLLTLWQTVPMLLMVFIILRGRVSIPVGVQPLVGAFFLIFLFSATYAVVAGPDPTRGVIRSFYYLSAFALFLFSYDMARRPEGYRLFVVGLAVFSSILAVYGLYQVFAASVGLPFRGILRGTGSSQAAFEAGVFRINSLASEPKRLGYVLFIGALAYFQLASWRTGRSRRKAIFWGTGVILVSILTLSGSYFVAVVAFLFAASLLYPVRIQKFTIPLFFLLVAFLAFGQNTSLYQALETGFERRQAEIEVGVDGQFVYRQEFFAQEYLENHPSSAITGVGVGQYFSVLNSEYGTGVGKGDKGRLLPINAALLELTFDLSGVAALMFYGALFALIWRLRQRGLVFPALSLLFLVLQSFSIQTLLYVVVFCGVGLARLKAGETERRALRGAHRLMGVNHRSQ